MRVFQTGIGAVAAIWIVTASVWAQEVIRWQADIEAARQQALQSNRLVLIHFVSRGCEPCARLDATVFSQASFAQALEADFVPVKVNATDFPITAQRFGVSVAPTDVVIAPGGQLVCKTGCPQDAAQYVAQLRRISDNYRRVTAEMAAANPSAATAAARPAHTPAAIPGNDPRMQAANVPPTAGASAWGQGAAQNNQALPERAAGFTPAVPATPPQPAASSAQLVNPTWSPDRAQAAPNLAQPITAPPITAQPAGAQATPGAIATNVQPAASQPSVALDGYCPVQLIEGQRWTAGDRRFGAVHRGRLYFFAGPTEQQRFMRDPDHYSPMLAGFDPVVWQESGQLISGRREHGVFQDNRVFLFATEESLAKFERNPAAFTAPVEQAMRTTGVRR